MIVINARFLTQPITGVQRFAIEISKELKKSNLPVVFLAPKNIIHHDLAQELDVKTLGRLKGHLWEQIELQTYVLKNNAFLVSFCNTGPLFVKKQIVTIHDLCFKVHPEWFSKGFSSFYNFLIPKLVKVSKAIITVSEVSKKELIDELSVYDEKITVIYNAVAPVFKEPNSVINSKRPLNDEYILSVSSHHPRKNFDRLVEAFKLIKRDNLKLCIIGNVNKNFNSKISENDENIIFLNNISDTELVGYYKFANLFVFPSLYEGFGIPIIEAMSLGTKVCVSDIPVFREICGDNTIYFNPLDVNDISRNMLKALNSSNDKLSQNNLADYSWNQSALKLIKLIEKNL
ncbi:glycosyltransferase family 4 protein [Flavobacterium sp. 245]|uniref:glycosyltransferase family 4 protein n=1 Tax=Flavobacterium sp. 245 TaxID=2512115 RepID=UPI00105D325D|nr:glycosyltransferase family 1 protein [Flavobacterium sp. 245]TDP02429.1 glycosyltransferase involved in cell wall biosynthesis [Flavobacterium sp. 245]